MSEAECFPPSNGAPRITVMVEWPARELTVEEAALISRLNQAAAQMEAVIGEIESRARRDREDAQLNASPNNVELCRRENWAAMQRRDDRLRATSQAREFVSTATLYGVKAITL